MLEKSRRLLLRYDTPGQFTFRHFTQHATDEQLYNIATLLNAFQTCRVDKVIKVRVYEF